MPKKILGRWVETLYAYALVGGFRPPIHRNPRLVPCLTFMRKARCRFIDTLMLSAQGGIAPK